MDNTWDLINHLRADRRAHLIAFHQQATGFSPQLRMLIQPWIERNISLSELVGENADENNARITILHARFLEELRNLKDIGGQTEIVRTELNAAMTVYEVMGPELWYDNISLCLREEMAEILAEARDQGQDNVAPLDFRSFCFATYVRRVSMESQSVSGAINHLIALSSNFRLLRQTEENMRARLVAMQSAGFYIQREDYLNVERITGESQQRRTELTERSNMCAVLMDTLTHRFERLRDRVESFMKPLRWSSYGFTEQIPSLDEVETWYQDLVNTIHDFHGDINKIDGCVKEGDPIYVYANLKTILNRVSACCLSLVSLGFVVETQPPRIILKGRRLDRENRENPVSVRFMCRTPNQQHPMVNVTITDENQTKALWTSQSLGNEIPSSGTITGSRGLIATNGNRVAYRFSDMTVTSMQRPVAERGPTDAIQQHALSSKFCFLFSTELELMGRTAQLWCCSQPFVFIVHSKQDVKATAIAFWDSFHSNDRIPFQTQQHVPWGIMSPALNNIFQFLSNTTRKLSRKHVEYLGQKLLGNQPTEQTMVPATPFLDFTESEKFWTWLYKAADLLKVEMKTDKKEKQLTGPWNDSYIIGFISRTETEEILRRKNQVGACVLRFSDSIPGAISFSYLYSEGGVSQVCNVAPFTKDDLLKQIMAERLKTELYGHEQTYICYEVDGQPDGIELIPATNIFETNEEKKKAVPPGYSLPRVLKVASKTVTRMLRVVRLKTARKVRGKQRERSNISGPSRRKGC